MILSIFSYAHCICLSSLVRCLFRSFAHSLNWLFPYWILSALDILWTSVLYHIVFANIFSQSVARLAFSQPSSVWWLPQRRVTRQKQGWSTIREVVSRGYTINIHKCIHGMGLKKHDPQSLKETQKSAMKETGTPHVHVDTQFTKALWAKGIRHVPHCMHEGLSREHTEDADSTDRLYTLVTVLPVTTV